LGKIISTRHWKGWLGVHIGYDLENLESLIETSEEFFKKKFEDFNNDIEQKLSKLTPEKREEFLEYGFDDDEYWKLSERFPQTFRMSILITLYSRFEYELVQICNELSEKYYLIKPDFKGQGLIFKAKKYFIDTVEISKDIFNEQWNNVIVYNIIRNAFVHKNGYIIGEEKQLKVKQFTESNSSIIKFQSPLVILERGFCEKVLGDISDLLISIYQSIEKKGWRTTSQEVFG
jgi:hypothetical protein